jgi:hypothetical protein
LSREMVKGEPKLPLFSIKLTMGLVALVLAELEGAFQAWDVKLDS